MTVSLTLAQAYAYAQEGVAERGANFVYKKEGRRCTYFHGTEPGCFVGYIANKAGLQASDLNETMNQSASQELCSSVLHVDAATRHFLMLLQGSQDSGITWGEALNLAVDEMLRSFGPCMQEAIKAADPKTEPKEEEEKEEEEKVEAILEFSKIIRNAPSFVPVFKKEVLTAPTAKELIDA